MANWLLVIDPDNDRRSNYASGLESQVAPVDGLKVSTLGGQGWSAVWAAARNAPIDTDSDDANYGAIVWGEPRNSDGQLQSAADIRRQWQDGASAQWDGFYSALVVEQGGQSVVVGTDVLGIFPVYYWSDGNDVLLVGTSPELFRTHPKFAPRFNLQGLTGILLTNGLVGGQTMWVDVKRLQPGNRLRLDGAKVFEDEAYRLPTELTDVDLPLTAHVDQLFEALSNAVKKTSSPDREYGLLLSGGLDSRMTAGLFTRAGIRPNALTLGLPSDLEMRCAKAVAERYELNHVTGEPPASDYPYLAGVHARWEHLSCGFTTIRDWWIQSRVRELGSHLITGGLADALVGGVPIGWAYSDSAPHMSFDNFMDQMPKLGIPPDVVKQLLRDSHSEDLVDTVLSGLRDEFESCSDRTSYCAWVFDLHHCQRFHVGGTVWRLAFGAWPVLPMLDREVISLVAGLPAASLADRALQLALVESRMPELGDVPMDRSDLLSEDPQYFHPEPRQLLADAGRRQVRRLRELLSFGRSRDSRYWGRVNNIDGQLWRQARHAAEKNRPLVEEIVDPEVLRIVLPPPSVKYIHEGPFIGESARKMMLGFMYWAENRLVV